MNTVDWRIEGLEFVNCNCDFGCPCQFNSLPTHGDCKAFATFQVDKGHFGDIRLDGLCFAMTLSWPGAIHQGNGEAQPFIDEKASPEQRDAILAIMSGETSEPGATFFNVFASTLVKMYDPIFCDIEFSCDVDARRAKVKIGDLAEASGEPILNPITGAEHRARIDLPNGFEYAVAEIANGQTTTRNDIPLELANSHAHLARLHIGPQGVVR